MLEQLLEQPVALAVIALVVVVGIGRFVWQRRRASALDDHAQEQGWRTLDDDGPFVARVLEAFPELRADVEQDARATRGRRGPARGPGTTFRVGRTPGARSDARTRGIYAAPIAGGEAAVGNIQMTGQAGKVAQGRASDERGAAIAELASPAPSLRLFGRSWLDRGGGNRLPPAASEHFSEDVLEDDAVASYLDPGAVDLLADVADHVDGIAVEGTTAVLVASRPLTPERAGELASTLESFLRRAADGDGASIRCERFPAR